MTIEEKFNGFKKEDLNKYEDQAIEKYGKGTIEESKKDRAVKKISLLRNLIVFFVQWLNTEK